MSLEVKQLKEFITKELNQFIDRWNLGDRSYKRKQLEELIKQVEGF